MVNWRDLIGQWERFDRPLRHAPRPIALFLLAAIVVLMAFGLKTGLPDETPLIEAASETTQLAEDDGDLALYRRIAQRVIAGEPYYAAAMAEQRAGNYPTQPFVTVRLPTLAMAQLYIGEPVIQMLLFIGLPAAIILMMMRVEGTVRPPERVGAGIVMLLGGAGLIIPDAPLIHEVVAGICLSLALVIYSEKCWWLALVFAALALSIRELAAPFVLLWLVFAVSQKRWLEAGVVLGVLFAFAAGMYLHYLGVEAQRMPEDMASQGWAGFAGPGLPLMALAQLTGLLFLPTYLAAPLAILPLLGWLGLGGRFGLFATLWFLGLFAVTALFARPENFYWMQMMLPLYLAGFAFVPRALGDIFSAIRGENSDKPSIQS